jgi:hypothetical protein
MKKNSILSFILLAALAAGASAAEKQRPADSFDLPTFVVAAERYTEAEQYIIASLEGLRRLGANPVAVTLELPALKTHFAQTLKPLPAVRLAKS